MKISDVIAELQKIKDEQGDLRVQGTNECGSASGLSEGDIYWHTTSTGEKLVAIDAS